MFEQTYEVDHRVRRLKRWIWIYFWLLIFEGSLRKWVLPSLSGPLLVIRDPVALMICLRAYQCGRFRMSRVWPFAILATSMMLLACAQFVQGLVTLPIMVYGLRSYALHPFLIFVLADTLDEEDIYKYGRWLMLLSIPMFFLVLAQFRAPAGSWLNAGAGEDAAQIVAAAGHIRPAGTFSFGIGMQLFEMLVGAFVLDALLRKGRYPAWLVYGSLFTVLAMIPMLGSRSVLFNMAALAAFVFVSGISRGSRLIGFAKVIVVLLLAAIVAMQLPFFVEATSVMNERWQQASRIEGDVGNVLNKRLLGPVQVGVSRAWQVSLLGKGIGIGSNFASVTVVGENAFLAGEMEWERVLYEFGPLFGLLFLGVRAAFAVYVALRAFHSLKGNSVLAWLLVPVVVPMFLIAIMEQSTYLGFMVFGAGLCLAAARSEEAAFWEASRYPEGSLYYESADFGVAARKL